jgi:hypothetical protein
MRCQATGSGAAALLEDLHAQVAEVLAGIAWAVMRS